MAGETPQRTPGAILLVTGGMLSAAIVFAGVRLAGAMRDRPADSPTIRLAPAERSRGHGGADLPASSAPSVAAIGQGRAIVTGEGGRVFLLVLDETHPPRLRIERVYKLRRDPSRHLDEPSRRARSGWYLDDLAAEHDERVRSLKATLEGRLGSPRGTMEEVETITALAEDLADAGELPFLTALLVHDAYLARRAAGIALGRGGWRRAVPALIEIAEQGDDRSRTVAAELLAGLTGTPAPGPTSGPAWTEAVAAWKAWWTAHGETARVGAGADGGAATGGGERPARSPAAGDGDGSGPR